MLRRRVAIVGVGATKYYRRAESLPITSLELTCAAIRTALDDAGLRSEDVDGITSFHATFDAGLLTEAMGFKELRYCAVPTGGGSGSVGAIILAESAIVSGHANVVVAVKCLQSTNRLGSAYAERHDLMTDFLVPFGALGPGHLISLMTQRHMHKYGTERRHFAEVCMIQRANAIGRPHARFHTELTVDEYFDARMISSPLCLYDYTLESDGAVAFVLVGADRARDTTDVPVDIVGSVMGGDGAWGRGFNGHSMPDDLYTTAGHGRLARRLYDETGIAPSEIDVALLYDHFSPMVLLQLEDWGFCPVGQSGPFVMDGHTRPSGTIPVNTHGGHLSEAYLMGLTHVLEAVEQLRGRALTQVDGAQHALVTGGPSVLPGSAMILERV